MSWIWFHEFCFTILLWLCQPRVYIPQLTLNIFSAVRRRQQRVGWDYKAWWVHWSSNSLWFYGDSMNTFFWLWCMLYIAFLIPTNGRFQATHVFATMWPWMIGAYSHILQSISDTIELTEIGHTFWVSQCNLRLVAHCQVGKYGTPSWNFVIKRSRFGQ